ncbi:MAG: helix-turn-helix domain-containing protein [Myxococcaceae bacterium]
MARPLDENRRTLILSAATKVFAEHGLSAPTALISKTAKISEGSFFTYFKTKDDLIAALYVQIRREVAAAINDGFPVRGTIEQRLEHVFTRFVGYGLQQPLSRRALAHLNLAKAVTARLRTETQLLYAEVDRIQADAIAQKRLHLPPVLPGPTIAALGDMTRELIEAHPAQAKTLMAAGFQMLWAALNSKPD